MNQSNEDEIKKGESEEEEDQIMDLSNIRDIQDLNQLTKMHDMQKQFVDVDNIELDIEEDDDEQQLEKMMNLQYIDDEPKQSFHQDAQK